MDFTEVTRHQDLSAFYVQNGLETSEDIEADDGAVYSIAARSDGALLAAATLSFRDGAFILDYIAVAPQFRRAGMGAEAVNIIAAKARLLGARKLYITARNPAFFKALGFSEGEPDGIDMNAGCKGCHQYGNGCSPLPMFLIL